MKPRLPSLAIARDGADFTRRTMEDKTERGISRVSFSEEAMSKDTKGDGSVVIVREERGTFLGPLMGRLTVSYSSSSDADAHASPVASSPSSSSSRRGILAFAPNDDDDDDRGESSGSPNDVKAEYDNLVVNMGLLKCGNRYRVAVPIPKYWKVKEEVEMEVEEEVVDGHGVKMTSISRCDSSSSSSSLSLDELVDVRIAEDSIDGDLKGEVSRDEDDEEEDRRRRRHGSVLSISLSAKQRGLYRGRFLLELTRRERRKDGIKESMTDGSHTDIVRSPSLSSMHVVTGRCLMSVLVEATMMGKDTGTPKLRNGVICSGKLVGYDSDDETEWQGFDH